MTAGLRNMVALMNGTVRLQKNYAAGASATAKPKAKGKAKAKAKAQSG